MIAVSASDFVKNFGKHNQQVQTQPIEVTSHGRVVGYYVSPEQFQALKQGRVGFKRHAYLKDLPPELIEAMIQSLEEAAIEAEKDPELVALDKLIESEPLIIIEGTEPPPRRA